MPRPVSLCLLLVFACAPAEERPEDANQAVMTAAPVTLADFAGSWRVEAMPMDQDTVLVTYQMTALPEREGWTVTFPDREPLPARVVALDADSLVLEMGPYASALREGATVTSVRSVLRLDGAMLLGTFTARYDTDAADSVLHGRHHGMRTDQ